MSQRPQPDQGVVSGSAFGIMAEALVLPSSLLIAAVLSRRVGPDGYGLFTLAASLIVWLEWIITAAFANSTVMMIGLTDNWLPVGRTSVRLYLGLGLVVALAVWISAPAIADLLDEPLLSGHLRLFSIDVPLFSLAQAYRSILMGLGAFKQRALATSARSVSKICFIALFLEAGLSVKGAILGCISASAVELLMARFQLGFSCFRGQAASWSSFRIYALPLFLSAICFSLYDKLDLYMLKILDGTTEQAGIYGAAQNLALLPCVFSLAVSPLVLSVQARMLHADDLSGAQAVGRDAMRSVLWLAPFIALVAGSSGEIIEWIYGASFASAARIFEMLIFAQLALVMITVIGASFTARGQPGRNIFLTGPLLPLAVLGHTVAIPKLGSAGAAMITTSLSFFGAVAATVMIGRSWSVFLPVGTVARSLGFSALGYAMASHWTESGLHILFRLPILSLVILGLFIFTGERGLHQQRGAGRFEISRVRAPLVAKFFSSRLYPLCFDAYFKLRFLFLFPFYIGKRLHCPFCGGRFRKFLPYGREVPAEKKIVGAGLRPDARCPRCHSLDRERLVYLFLKERSPLWISSGRKMSVLHLAPERNLQKVLRKLTHIEYRSGDLNSPLAAETMDLTNLNQENNSFDAVICCHVLNCLPDDRKALSEMFRVLKPGGFALLQVPVALALAHTEEGKTAWKATEDEPWNYTRLYGRDYADRLRDAGFVVDAARASEIFPEEMIRRWGLIRDEMIFRCSKP